MKNNQVEKVISILVMLLPVVFAGIVYQSLPASMPIHYGMNGEANFFLEKNLAVFGAPIGLLVIQCLLFLLLTNCKNKCNFLKFFHESLESCFVT